MIDNSKNFDRKIRQFDKDYIELIKKEKKLLEEIDIFERKLDRNDPKKISEELTEWEKSCRDSKRSLVLSIDEKNKVN